MTHYHLTFINEYKDTISQVRYESMDEAAIAFVDMCFYLYPEELDIMFRGEYIGHVLEILDQEDPQVVTLPSKKLTIGVMKCPYEDCAAATNN